MSQQRHRQRKRSRRNPKLDLSYSKMAVTMMSRSKLKRRKKDNREFAEIEAARLRSHQRPKRIKGALPLSRRMHRSFQLRLVISRTTSLASRLGGNQKMMTKKRLHLLPRGLVRKNQTALSSRRSLTSRLLMKVFKRQLLKSLRSKSSLSRLLGSIILKISLARYPQSQSIQLSRG